jgi:hypothetical protein
MPRRRKSPGKEQKEAVYGYAIDIAWEDWPNASDGVATNVPMPSSRMVPSNDVSWRRILGKVWVKYWPIDGEEGRVYELTRLPPGEYEYLQGI